MCIRDRFNAVHKNSFLEPEQSLNSFQLLANQPESNITRTLRRHARAADYRTVSIDPTRGSLLSLILQNPGFFERINQGGLVGYLILIILLFGLFMGGMRFRFLVNERRSIDEELSSGSLKSGSPLYEINQIIYDTSVNQ